MEALYTLPEKRGSKSEIIEAAVQIYPPLSKETNPQFYKTLEQAISKHLTVLPRTVSLVWPHFESGRASDPTKKD